MARKFLTAIDLAKNELQNGVVQNLASAPGSPVKGQLYFDSTTNILYWYSGTVWVPAQGGVVSYGVITAETAFGAAKADGVATTLARSDHAHGNPTHLAADHSTIPISALAAAFTDVSMANNKLTNLAPPVAGGDATNKTYVDNLVAGLSWKDAVRVATTANVANFSLGFQAGQVIDGVTLGGNDRILIKDQTTASQNGLYNITGSAPTRVTDADTATELDGAAVFVEEGTVNSDTAWVMTTNPPITVGTTGLTWTQFAGGGTVTAGAGMTQSGNTLNVIGDASITVAADAISRAALTGDVTAAAGANATTIANDVVTNAKLANMNSFTLKGNNTGSAADPVDLTTAFVKGMLGLPTDVAGIYAQDVGGATTVVVNHNLNSRDVTVNVYRVATPWDTVESDVERTDVNNVTVRFAVAPAAAEYRCVVIG